MLTLRRRFIKTLLLITNLAASSAQGFDDASVFEDLEGESSDHIIPDINEELSWFDGFNAKLDLSGRYKPSYAREWDPILSDKAVDGSSSISLRLSLSYEKRYSKLLKLRFEAIGTGLYEGKGSSDAPSDKPGITKEELFETGQSFISLSPLEFWDMKIGKLIVPWGHSNLIRVNDVLNPIDLREPGVTALDESKVPLGMVKSDIYSENFGLSLIGIGEIAFHKRPDEGSDYYLGSASEPQEEIPPSTIANMEYGLSLTGTLGRWQLGFYRASYFSDEAHMVTISSVPVSSSESVPTGFQLEHERLEHEGLSVAISVSKFNFAYELAFIEGLNTPNELNNARIDNLMSIEFSNGDDHFMALELASHDYRSDFDHPSEESRLLYKPRFEIAGLYRGTFYRNLMTVELIKIAFGDKQLDSGMNSLSLDYKWNDSSSIYSKAVVYEGAENSLYQDLLKNNQYILGVKLSFP